MLCLLWLSSSKLEGECVNLCNFLDLNNFWLLFFQVETELKLICCDILDVLDKHLIPAANTGESKVFYYKM